MPFGLTFLSVLPSTHISVGTPFICSRYIFPSRLAMICAVAYLIPSMFTGKMQAVPAGMVIGLRGKVTPHTLNCTPRLSVRFCSLS